MVRALSRAACLGSLAAALGTQEEPNPPSWPDSVKVFGPEDDVSIIQAALDDSWAKNGGQDPSYREPTARYSPHRFWFAFKPGTYKVDAPLGYYVHLSGIGASPREVVFKGGSGPHVPCNNTLPAPGQLVTFWRAAERFKRVGDLDWFVSQAAPLRDLYLVGNLNLDLPGAYGSGGYLANAIVTKNVHGGEQQQWFARNVEVHGRWTGIAWSAVFVGCISRSNESHMKMNTCADEENNLGQTVVVEKTPLVAEKPFISVDPGDQRKFNLNVPLPEKDVVGSRLITDNIVYPFEAVYVTQTNDTVADMSAKLAAGLHLVISPGIYLFDAPLKVERDDQVVLCLGLATLVSTSGNALIEVAPGLGGVRIAGCLLEAGPMPTAALLQWGDESSRTSSKPSFMHDLFSRVGGPAFEGRRGNEAQADTQVRIDADDVVADHLWLWRGDHYANQTSNTDASEPDDIAVTSLGELPNPHGLIVSADRVRVYSLAVEHATEDQVIWSGEDGEVYFFQCEVPYEMDPAWAAEKYVSYNVTPSVKRHKAYGAGAYAYFPDYETWMYTAFSVPEAVEKTFVQPFIVKLPSKGGINTTINGKGGGVGWPGEGFQKLYNNNNCTYRPQEPPMEPTPAPTEPVSFLPWIMGGVGSALVFGVAFMMNKADEAGGFLGDQEMAPQHFNLHELPM